MNPSRLKYLLVFVLLTSLTSASFALDTDGYNEVLNQVELFGLAFVLSIHTFPIFPSKTLSSTAKDLDSFKVGSEIERSVAVSFFYLGGALASFISIFFAPEWNIQGKVADVTYNRFFMDSDSKAIAKRFKISYQLSIAAGILFSGLLKQYVLNRSFSAWKNFNAANALLSFLFSVLAVCRLFISLSNSNPNPNIQETIELNGISPSLDNNETNSNLDSDPNAGFGKIFENLILFVCLYMFQQFSSISGYFSYTEEIFADSPNIYIVLGVANFVGTLLNVAIEALKDSEDACNNCLGNLVNHFDIKSIILISGVFFSLVSWKI
ncbi:hypothetical protein MDAP_002886 [Mitosporidium daphniae]